MSPREIRVRVLGSVVPGVAVIDLDLDAGVHLEHRVPTDHAPTILRADAGDVVFTALFDNPPVYDEALGEVRLEPVALRIVERIR